MPRKSPEALAGAWFRAEQQHGAGGRPKPPKWLKPEAAKTFTDIVNSRAPDLFAPASLELIAHFCQMNWCVQMIWQERDKLPIEDPKSMRLQRIAIRLVSTMCTIAAQCALLPRHVHGRRSGVLTETYDATKVVPWQRHV